MKPNPQPLKITAPRSLWDEAGRLVQVLFAVFGEPLALLRKLAVSRAEHQRIVSWLRCAEALLRHLLLIEAAAMPLSEAAPARARSKAARTREPITFDPETPESWRVSFRCLPPGRHAHKSARSARKRAPLCGTKALALRLQAILRVFDRPVEYVSRLARLLRRTPQRAGQVLAAPPEAIHRIDRFSLLREHAEAAAGAFNSS